MVSEEPELEDIVSGSAIIAAKTVYDEGPTFQLVNAGEVRVSCTEGVLREALDHAQSGLPATRSEDDAQAAVEVKGFLLGTVWSEDDGRLAVRISRTVQLPTTSADACDAAQFSASEYARLELELRKHSQLQLVGCYHSHPGHPLRLSEPDAEFLSRNFGERYHVACIVQPRERKAGFFLRVAAAGFRAGAEADSVVSYDDEGMPQGKGVRDPDGTGGTVIPQPPPPPPPPWWKRLEIVLSAAAAVVAVLAVVLLRPDDSELDTHPRRLEFAQLEPGQSAELSFTVKLVRGDQVDFIVGTDSEHFEIVQGDGADTLRKDDPPRDVTVRFTAPDSDGTYQGIVSLGEGHDVVQCTADVKTVNGDEIPIPWPEQATVSFGVTGGRIVLTVRSPEPGQQVDLSAVLRPSGGSRQDSGTKQSLRLEWAPSDVAVQEAQSLNVDVKMSWTDHGGARRRSTKSAVLSRKNAPAWVIPPPTVDQGFKFSFQIPRPPRAAAGDVRCRVLRGNTKVTELIIGPSGREWSYDVWDQPWTDELSLQCEYIGSDGLYSARASLPLHSPDAAFIKNQGTNGRRVLHDHPDKYKDHRLREIGTFSPPLLHVDDLGVGNTYWYVQLTMNEAVSTDSWKTVNAFAADAKQRGAGTVAWGLGLNQEKKSRVMLMLVLPGEWNDEQKRKCELWLGSHADLMAVLKDETCPIYRATGQGLQAQAGRTPTRSSLKPPQSGG